MYMDIWQFQVHDIGSGFTKSIGEITTQTLWGGTARVNLLISLSVF